MSEIDKSILKELDHQRLDGNIISTVMNKLDTADKKYQFLSFMHKKRNTILSLPELFDTLKAISN